MKTPASFSPRLHRGRAHVLLRHPMPETTKFIADAANLGNGNLTFIASYAFVIKEGIHMPT